LTAPAEPFTRTEMHDGKRARFYSPHEGQWRILDCEARFILAPCGTQSGKTTLEPLWTQQEVKKYPVCTQEGEGDHLVVSASYDLLDAKVRPAYERLFCHETRWGAYKASRNMIISNRDKSRIVFRSAESPEGLESFTALSAVCDEFGQQRVTVGAWEAVLRRLSTNRGRALIATTPYCLGWLYQQVYKRAVGGDPDYAVVSFPSIDNPAFSAEEYERARATLPAWKFEMFYNGRFSRPAGLIYGDYEDSYAPQGADGRVQPAMWRVGQHGHLVKPFPIPANWMRIVGLDFGGADHTALLYLAEEPREADGSGGNVYAYRERLGGGLSGAEHALAALEYREPVRVWTGGARSEDSARTTWALAGVPVAEPLIQEVEAGIDRVVGLFRQRRAFVFDTLTGLRSELGTYSRELDDSGEPLLKIQDKERFHRLDCLRYAASWVELYREERPSVIPTLPPRARLMEEVMAARREQAQEGRDGVHGIDDGARWGG
jgi:hypothetical protein